jgi:glycosyltransferase involved in cell wall biosynthesis
MKIAIIPGSCAPFHARTLEERPLGGIETAVIRFAKALSDLGHSVYVLSRIDNPPPSKPLYLPMRCVNELGDVDVLIAVRELLPLFLPIARRTAYFWTGDSYDQLQHLGLGDLRVRERLNAALCVSEWQADKLCAASGFPRSQCRVLRNGVDHRLFEGSEDRFCDRLIYTSTPYRGLVHLARLFPKIRERVPGATLHVFSSFKVYDGTSLETSALDLQWKPLFDKLQALPGVSVHGNIRQDQLAREFMKSAVLAYPNTFEETSCITAIEAMAAGCPVVTTNSGALAETVGNAGIVIDGNPGDPLYDTQFVEEVASCLGASAKWQELSRAAKRSLPANSWQSIATSFAAQLEENLRHSPLPAPTHSVVSPIIR